VIDLDLERCRIRPWSAGDLEPLVRHADNRNVWINLRDRFPHPYTRADAEMWLRRCAEQRPATNFAIEVDGEAAGGIGLVLGVDVHRLTAEIGFWLGEDVWGRGIASEAVAAFSAEAFARFDLHRLHAGVFEWNAASMRVLEKCGYVREGRLRRSVVKDGRTIDQILYAILRSDLRS